jgi:hypothetical protein
VTYGQNVAYTATITNTGRSSLENVQFHNPIPTTSGGAATNPSASCAGGALTATEFVCPAIHKLRRNETATVTIAWRTPAAGSSSNCAAATPPAAAPCLTNSASWTIKKDDDDDDDDDPHSSSTTTLELGPVAVSLIAVGDPGRAAGFATTACSNPATPTIATNQSLGSGNPLATSVCAPNLPTTPITGIAAAISERDRTNTDPGITQVSDICLPAPGSTCGGTPFHFSSRATFTFLIDNAALPPVCSGGGGDGARDDDNHNDDGGHSCQLPQITKVFHDGHPTRILSCSSSPSADPCVSSITFDSHEKRTTVVVKASENGQWDFG